MTQRVPGFLNCDLYPGPNIDVVFDAAGEWPFKDNSIKTIEAVHVLEHLAEPTKFLNEAYRVLIPSPTTNIQLRLPYGPSESGFGDITHLRQYVASSFACFAEGWSEQSRNRQYDKVQPLYGLDLVILRIDPRLRGWLKPVLRRFTVPLLPFLWGGFVEIIVQMHPLKGGMPSSHLGRIPLAYAMFDSHYRGQATNSGLLKFFPEKGWF